MLTENRAVRNLKGLDKLKPLPSLTRWILFVSLVCGHGAGAELGTFGLCFASSLTPSCYRYRCRCQPREGMAG